jgi:ActR/RegA family two-component response regulator
MPSLFIVEDDAPVPETPGARHGEHAASTVETAESVAEGIAKAKGAAAEICGGGSPGSPMACGLDVIETIRSKRDDSVI